MKHSAASCQLVEVVDVLRDYVDIIVVFELRQAVMCGIRLASDKLPATLVIELMDQRRIANKACMARHFHYGIVFPKTVGVAESFDTAFGTDTRSGQYYKSFHCF